MTTDESTRNAVEPPVVFFDGECGLCNRFMRWLLARDRQRTLQFAQLQGTLAAAHLPPLANDEREWSVAYWDENGVHIESDAALLAIARIGGVWRCARWLRIVPRFIRDSIYRVIARNRIRWFGRVDACALISPEDRARILP